MLNGRALSNNVEIAIDLLPPPAHCKKLVSILPLAHAYGQLADFLYPICCGCHINFLTKTPTPAILLKALQEVKPYIVTMVPLVIEKIYKKQIQPMLEDPRKSWVFSIPGLNSAIHAQIRTKLLTAFGGEVNEVIMGGAPLNAEVENFFKKIEFPFTIGYGMTETAPLISYTWWEDFKPFSCGRVLEGLMEMKIDHPNADGIGEILVRGEHVMKGYYKNEAATRKAFTKDGWLKTGDLGLIDEDGFLFIKGRNKTMLLGPSGQNIYPEEIEAKLNNMPFVMESLVIQHEDKLVALVCPDYDAIDQAHLDSEAVEAAMEDNRKALNGALAAYEQITQIKLYPHEFEKTPKRSIKRFLYTSIEEL